MKVWWLSLSACCLACGFGSPAGATEPLVVLERAEYVRVLERVDYLAQDRANLEQQVTAALQEIAVLRAQVQDQMQVIEAIEAQLEIERKKQEVVNAERARLQAELERRTVWSDLKDYGLVGLGVAVVILAIL